MPVIKWPLFLGNDYKIVIEGFNIPRPLHDIIKPYLLLVTKSDFDEFSEFYVPRILKIHPEKVRALLLLAKSLNYLSLIGHIGHHIRNLD